MPPQDRDRQGALVFDFDGTLVDSSDIKERAYIAAITEAIAAPEAEVQRAYRAHGTLNRVPQLSRAFCDLAGRDPEDHVLKAMVASYGRFVRARSHEVRPFDGMQEFLEAHRRQQRLVVASNAPQDELEAVCSALGLQVLFDRIYGYPTTKEEAIHRVRRDWGLPRWRVLYIGDRAEDALVAQRAGVAFCRFGPIERDEGSEVVRTLPELERVVDGLGTS